MSDENLIDFEISIDPFGKKVRGAFGRFQTDKSYPLHFLLTTFRMKDLGQLKVAADVFPIEKSDFNDVMQRDVDMNRVREIASTYLAQEKKAIFFPPLLVAIVLQEADGSLKEQYDFVNVEKKSGNVIFTYDTDKFRMQLPIAKINSGELRKVAVNGEMVPIFEFGALLEYNESAVQLIVLDGQHRLEALNTLLKNPDKRGKIESIEVPVCIAFPTGAKQGAEEEIQRDLREIFVTVNNESKKVSGHFKTLLDDESLSAETVRQLANEWKSQSINDGLSRLHLLEWNQRIDSLTSQVTRRHALSTVTILDDTLKEHLYKGSDFPWLLRLDEVIKNDDGTATDESWRDIMEGSFPVGQLPALQQQIKQYLVPALDVLFNDPAPYQQVREKLITAYSQLCAKADANNTSFSNVKTLFSKFSYNIDNIEQESVQAAYKEFESWIDSSPKQDIYRFSVFQQAYLRTWIALTKLARGVNKTPFDAAKGLVAALGWTAFGKSSSFLSRDRSYVKRVQWRDDRVNASSKWALDSWYNLLRTSFLHPKACKACVIAIFGDADSESESASKLAEDLRSLALDGAIEQQKRFLTETATYLKRTYADQILDESLVARLERLERSEEKDDLAEFRAEIQKLAQRRLEDARVELSNVLDVKLATLPTIDAKP